MKKKNDKKNIPPPDAAVVRTLIRKFSKEPDPYFPFNVGIQLHQIQEKFRAHHSTIGFEKSLQIDSIFSDFQAEVEIESYKLVDKILSQKNITDKKKEIRKASKNVMLEKFSQPEERDYLLVVKDYCKVAANHPETKEKAIEAFKKFFYKDFKDSTEDDKDCLIPSVIFTLIGLEDIRSIDFIDNLPFHKNKVGCQSAGLKLREIYYKSILDSHVLIIGETGTSKEYMAHAIHLMNERNDKAYEPIDCTGLTDELISSELFGHEKGAFTGAAYNKQGLFEIADGGTIFIDEIGKASKPIQARLLRVMDEGKFRRVGATKIQKPDVRIIAAIQPQDIDDILPDLLYRLNYGNAIYMPPLRERLKKAPITVIENSFNRMVEKMKLKKMETEEEKVPFRLPAAELISVEARNKLLNYPYPGNYRDLESILEKAFISATVNKRGQILPEDINFPEIPKFFKENIKSSEIKAFKNDNIPAVFQWKEIDELAKKYKTLLVSTYVDRIKKEGGNFSYQLKEKEGLPHSQYTTATKVIKEYTGKSVKQIKKS